MRGLNNLRFKCKKKVFFGQCGQSETSLALQIYASPVDCSPERGGAAAAVGYYDNL